MNKEIPSVEEDVIYAVYRLKTDPAPFQKVKCWEKTGEVRTNDRNFQAGGILILEEYDRKTGKYTNDAVERKISEVTPLDDYGCPGKVLLSFDLSQAITQATADLQRENERLLSLLKAAHQQIPGGSESANCCVIAQAIYGENNNVSL